MLNDIRYIQKNHPEMESFSFTNEEVIGKFRNGKSYTSPIEEFKSVLTKLQKQYDNENRQRSI